VTSPHLVDGAVLESVGGGSSRSPLQAVVEHLREATGLLVLDCCEHVLDAARLFADRASHVQPRFKLGEDVAGAVEAIVRKVDGIPLAIELAAARVRVLSAAEIADGLDDHLRLLRGGHRSDPRHQTIRVSLDWSHDRPGPRQPGSA
jgi:predicted ATPase